MNLVNFGVHEGAIMLGTNTSCNRSNVCRLSHAFFWGTAILPKCSWKLSLDQAGGDGINPNTIIHKLRSQALNQVIECGFGTAVNAEAVLGVCARYRGHNQNIGCTWLLAIFWRELCWFEEHFFAFFYQEESGFYVEIPHLIILFLCDVKLVSEVGGAGSIWHKNI